MEVRAAKGTARLLHLSLPNSVIAVGEAFDPEMLRRMLHADGLAPVLLYPSGDAAQRCSPSQLPPSGTRLVVLDHADEDVWGDLPNVILAEEWRESALVPFDWLQDE